MNNNFIAHATITINAPASEVWQALIDPEKVKQYLFGTQVTTDWQVGSPITYRGTWQGKVYEDKGKVIQNEAEKLLVSTFWSSLSGKPDRPENYNTIRFELSKLYDATRLTITQDNNASQEEADHSSQNWSTVLQEIKKLVES